MTAFPESKAAGAARTPWTARLYASTLAVMALTGFGQMPIYNRYYMSDIPGLGWLADFYATRYVHYIGASVLLAVIFYAALEFLLLRKGNLRLTSTGWLRAALLGGVVLSGSVVVMKNFPYVYLPETFIIGLNLFHLGLAVALLLANLLSFAMKKRWTAGI